MARMLAVVDPEIDEVRGSDEQPATGHEHAVHHERPAVQKGHSEHEQGQAGYRQGQRQTSVVAPIPGDQGQRGKDAGEGDEAGFEPMIGQERQAEHRQQRDHEGQRRAVDRAEERGRGAEAVGHMPPASGHLLSVGFEREIGHGMHSVTSCTGPGK